MPKKAFTLLELIVVIIIIGILATLGFSQYAKMMERGRTSEARMILGQLRTLEIAYYQEHGVYAAIEDFGLNIPTQGCRPTHYFMYFCDSRIDSPTPGQCQAQRCTGGGKTPNAVPVIYNETTPTSYAYVLYITIAGTLYDSQRAQGL